MRKFIILAGAAGALALAGQVLAAPGDPSSGSMPDSSATSSSTPDTSAPPASTPPPQSPTTPDTAAGSSAAAAPSASAAALAVGQPVKDNTGATIGSIADLKSDSTGKQTAVIQMGDQKFQVAANNLGMSGGAAVINLSQAEIANMLHGKSSAH